MFPQADTSAYDDELARVEAEIARLRAKDVAADKERMDLEAKIQAAQFQRDILAHANRQSRVNRQSAGRAAALTRVVDAAFGPPRWGLGSLLRLIIMLLPAGTRDRYLEEWRGELYDLRADGAPWPLTWRDSRRNASALSRITSRAAATNSGSRPVQRSTHPCGAVGSCRTASTGPSTSEVRVSAFSHGSSGPSAQMVVPEMYPKWAR